MSVANQNYALELDTKEFFRSLNRATSVLHIATFDGLKTCDVGDRVRVIEKEEYSPYDFLVVTKGASLVGLLEKDAAQATKSDFVGEVFSPISERNIISEEAGVLDFLLEANRTPARLVLSRHEIRGIVTIADLQKLPVRTAVFAMIMHLELLLTDILRRIYSDCDDIIAMVRSRNRRKICRDKFRDLISNDLCIDQFGALEFCDKRDLLCLRNDQLELSKRIIERELKAIENARNSLAHGGDYALTRKKTAKFIDAAVKCKEWIDTRLEFSRP